MYAGVLMQYGLYYVLLFFFGISLKKFFAHSRTATLTAFVTRSSLGTLPVTMRSAERLGIRERLYGFSLPLGATMNMDGAAMRVGVSVVFAANVVGLDLTIPQMLGIVLTGTLASVGTAGVPGAGLITLATVLVQAGLPVEVVALIAGVDVLLGMAATSLNVTGDLVGTMIVDKSETKKQAS
nr:cation:dicarboxylase symporter family transporter [Halobacillus amylolyticus]